mmetsp:Transcript_791/g.2125  ORF Transcript_791/g.2125 Transcript_791/m.2125 type:complete len:204 (-) Transcript_791:339-950(-)
MVPHHPLHRVLVPRKLGDQLAVKRGVQLDARVVTRHRQHLPGAVKGGLVHRVLAGGQRHDLSHHAHVPQLDHAICITRSELRAHERERRPVARVEVAVEGLRAQPAARVPDGHRLVAGRGGQRVREGLPHRLVHAVHVAAQRHAALARGHVPQPHRVVQGRGRQHVALVVVRHAPHRLLVVREREHAALLRKVPDLDRALAAA